MSECKKWPSPRGGLKSRRGVPLVTVIEVWNMDKIPITYIVADRYRGALYVGVTSDLIGRIYQHKNGLANGFTKRYSCKILVYYETHDMMEHAIIREKQS